jgi:putative ABC transport system substrate-binding protein
MLEWGNHARRGNLDFGFSIADFGLKIPPISSPLGREWGKFVKNKIITLALCAMLFALCSPAEAQQAKKVYRVGFLGDSPPYQITAFQQRLQELGWVEGQNIITEYRIEEARGERLPGLAAELVRLKVDLIVATSTRPAWIAKQATSTIPIVFAGASDPVEAGLVASLARPGGNVTGIRSLSAELGGKRLELLKEVVPKLSRVATLWIPSSPGNQAQMKEVEVAARSLGVQFQPVGVEAPYDFDNAFSAIIKGRAGGLVPLSGPQFSVERTRIIDLAAKHRLPTIYPEKSFVEDGGLMSYGRDVLEQYRRAASYVDKILKGTKPAELPVEQPMKFELIINLKTAKQLGLTIPPNVLARADRVIR